MKLLEKARAVLTIGPLMCKDKLMQAAGRMRKLDRGQGLIFAIPEELAVKICPANEVMKSINLLRWVMHNTVKATADGLPEWAAQGSHYCTTKHPKARLMDEVLELKDLYGTEVSEETIYLCVLQSQRKYKRRIEDLGVKIGRAESEIMQRIAEHSEIHGSDLNFVSSGVDEECEREVEAERELEREITMQIPQQKPQRPRAWDFSSLLFASDPESLPKETGVVSLAKAMKNRFAASKLDRIKWNMCKVFMTWNFLETVETREGARLSDLSDFMRPVDVAVVFESAESCLLLSEWEADEVISLLWKASDSWQTSSPRPPALVNLAYLVEVADSGGVSAPKLQVPQGSRFFQQEGTERPLQRHLASHVHLSEHTVAGLQLLAGHTMFRTDARKKAVADLLSTREAQLSALRLVGLRGLQHMVARSDLEEICSLEEE